MKRNAIAGFLAITAMAFLLYFPFLAIQYDTNGIAEAQAVEAGPLFPHNHILYRPIGWAVYRAATLLGYTGRSLYILQILDAVFGAIAVGLAYLAFEQLSRNRIAAIGAGCWLATSFLYWYVSTDVTYIPLAALFCAASLVFAVRGSSIPSALAVGIFVALGILTWQACIFLMPGLVLLLASRPDRKAGIAAVGAAGAIAGLAYVALGIVAYNVRSLGGFFKWILSYGSGGTLSMWGQWGMARIPEALRSAIHSLVPTLLMIGPSDVLARKAHLGGGIAVDIGAACTAALLLLSVYFFLFRLRGKYQYAAFCFLAAYAFFIPFIVWWDPGQPEWYVIPNILLAGFITLSWDAVLPHRVAQVVFLGCIVAIAGGNFFSTFRPRHAQPGPDRLIAQCVSEHTDSTDVVIAAEWGWPDYLEYLHGRNAFNLINNSIPFGGDTPRFLAYVRQLVKDAQKAGGKVLTADPSQYSDDHLKWLESQTGITRNDLKSFESTPGFVCEGRSIRILADLK